MKQRAVGPGPVSCPLGTCDFCVRHREDRLSGVHTIEQCRHCHTARTMFYPVLPPPCEGCGE